MNEKKRLVLVSIGTFFLFSLLIVQYFKIQVVDSEKWKTIALSQHQTVVKEPYRRGSFFSNTSLKAGHPESPQPFVFDVNKFHLFADPLSIPEEQRAEVAAKLAALQNLELEKVTGELARKSRSRKLAPWLSRSQKEKILTWWRPYARRHKIPRNALFFITDYRRSYPFGKLLGQVLHTIRDLKDEKTGEAIPTGGLEAHFHDLLKGKPGVRKLLRSPLHHIESDTVVERPEDGANIYLTVNHCIQAIAEEELEKGVKAANAKGGWAIMMDPHTGEILACAQYPFFDPANYSHYFNDPEKLEAAKVRPLSDAIELGSIMKPITIAIALQANEELVAQGEKPLFDPHEAISTTRSSFPGRRSKPLKDTSPAKKENMYMAIQKSSNIYMAQLVERIVERMGNLWYRDQLTERFGFEKSTGLELPGETLGLVPTPGKMHPNGALEWSLSTPYSLSFGHNITASGFQMVRAWAVLANGGHFVQPTLVRKIVKGEQVLLDNTQKKEWPKVLSDATAYEVLKALKFTTKGGSGRRAAINGYTHGGKTGTAEKIVGGVYSHKQYISSFIGFTPANLDPAIRARFVLLVSIDEPEVRILPNGLKGYFGGLCAAPVFREIGRRTLEYLGVPPDDPFGYPVGDPRRDPDRADWVKETKELKELFDSWNKKR